MSSFKTYSIESSNLSGCEVKILHPVRPYTPVVGPHRHDFFEVICVRRGRGTHLIDFEHYPIEDQMVFALRPGPVHQLVFSGDVEGLIISFSPEFLALYQSHEKLLSDLTVFRGDPPFLRIPEWARVASTLSALEQHFTSKGFGAHELVRSHLTILLVTLEECYRCQESGTSRAPEVALVDRFLALLDSKFDGRRTLADYAHMLGVTPNHLNDVVRKHRDTTAGALSDARVLLEAKRLLFQTDLPLGRISEEIGFSDASSFSRFFRSHTSQTPADFRRSSRSSTLSG